MYRRDHRCRLASVLALATVAHSLQCNTYGPRANCGFQGITQQDCKSRQCCWQSDQTSFTPTTDQPWCFYSENGPSEYELITTTATDVGWKGVLRNLTSTQPELGPDITTLQVTADTSHDDILHISITDLHDTRWRIPAQFYPEWSNGDAKPQESMYDLSYASTPFSFEVARTGSPRNASCVFNSTGQRLVFKDQYIELTTAIAPNSSLFGAEERTASQGLQLQRAGTALALWNKDTLAATADQNLYGSHPFIMEVQPDGSSHGVLLMSSNGMDVVLDKDTLSWRIVGGMVDLYILMGPTPGAVLEQLTRLIGRPALPPYWSLGFHQCKWGYKNVDDLSEVVAKYQAADLPLEAMWTDIDYMDGYRDFSLDPNNFPKAKMQEFVGQMHANKQKWVPIVDPGIKVDPGYPAYDKGILAEAFVTDFTGEPYLGQVWPGATHFPDFLSKSGVEYWAEQLQDFHKLAEYDGLWIDMNEASNFCTGEICHLPSGPVPNASAWLSAQAGNQGSSNDCQLQCDTPQDLASLTPQQKLYINPPYQINNANGQPIDQKTLGVTAVHADGSLEYNAHNLYGLSEADATYGALQHITGKRPFMLTRSSFLGSGARAAHWTGDNAATWEDLRWSISTTLGMGLMGVPFVGSDICGFIGDTTEELCARWISAGAFYPFSRDHNNFGAIPQELYRWDSVAKAGRSALGMRYKLLPHLYTAFHQSHIKGTPVAKPLWFAYPSDPNTHAINDQWLFGDVLISPVLHQGATKRRAYFPKGTWHSLLDNSTVDAREGGKMVNLELPIGEIGVHMPAGTIIPMQQSALLTEDVRASPLTLVIALPPMRPLPKAQHVFKSASGLVQPQSVDSHVSAGSQAQLHDAAVETDVRGVTRKLLSDVLPETQLAAGEAAVGARQLTACGVSEPGLSTACGQIYMDDGDQLQVGQSRDNLLSLYAELRQDSNSSSWYGILTASFTGSQKGTCGDVKWPVLDTVIITGVLDGRLDRPVNMAVSVGATKTTLLSRQVVTDHNQMVVSDLQHQLQCEEAFDLLWFQ